MIILKILLFIVLFLVGLLLLLLISPIKGSASLKNDSRNFSITYLFGLIGVDYDQSSKSTSVRILWFKTNSSNDKSASTEKNDAKDKKNKAKKEKKKQVFVKPSLKVITISLKLLKRIVSKIFPRNAKVNLVIGLDDPYDSYIIELVSNILFIPLNNKKDYDFKIKAVFEGYEFQFDCDGEVNFSIMSLILPIFPFLLKKPIRKYIKAYRKKKKKYKIENTHSKKTIATQ